MKKIFVIMALLFATASQAQVLKATLQASGLTCSMCSNAINKALKSLDFVEKVEPNIKNSSFDISFKPGSRADFDKLREKVEDAGFFVANLSALIRFNNTAVENDSHLQVDGITFHFMNVKDQTINGDKEVKIIDKGFVTSKVYKQNAKYTTMECYKTGKAASCCAKDGLQEGSRIYHATI
ncbi:MAG: heavy-metal-associated domain-containing protein [Ferruginibacter sp.]